MEIDLETKQEIKDMKVISVKRLYQEADAYTRVHVFNAIDNNSIQVTLDGQHYKKLIYSYLMHLELTTKFELDPWENSDIYLPFVKVIEKQMAEFINDEFARGKFDYRYVKFRRLEDSIIKPGDFDKKIRLEIAPV